MDKRMDFLLKKTWESTIGYLKPEMLVTVVARNIGFPKFKLILNSQKNYIVIFSYYFARSGIYSGCIHRVCPHVCQNCGSSQLGQKSPWLKTWPGDRASKVKLCGIPLMGDLLYVPVLEAVLDRTADKNKSFPVKRKPPVQTKNGSKGQGQRRHHFLSP